jgi:hypothetical protein
MAKTDHDSGAEKQPIIETDGVRRSLTPEERRWFAEECLAQNRELRRLSSIWEWLFGGDDGTVH